MQAANVIRLQNFVPAIPEIPDYSDIGYRHAEAAVKAERDKQALVQACEDAGIKPFDPDSIARYKRAMARNWNRLWLLLPASLIAGFIGAAILVDPLFVFAAVGVFLLCAFSAIEGGPFPTKEWKNTALRAYGRPIPDAALKKALALKKNLDGVDFRVETLVKSRRAIDPILVAEYNGQELAIAIWDEPEWDAKVW